jgi:hypothetical protein
MGKKIAIVTVSIILLITFFTIFTDSEYKLKLFGNTNNKSIDKIKSDIINMRGFEAEAKLVIRSNKTENTYVVKQVGENNQYMQEMLEPQNVAGLTIRYDGKDMKVENTSLGLNKIFEDYSYITSNSLSLSTFAEDYRESSDSTVEENKNEFILKTKVKNDTRYVAYKSLYIDKNTGKPVKLEVQDNTQNTLVYILYTTIEIAI